MCSYRYSNINITIQKPSTHIILSEIRREFTVSKRTPDVNTFNLVQELSTLQIHAVFDKYEAIRHTYLSIGIRK